MVVFLYRRMFQFSSSRRRYSGIHLSILQNQSMNFFSTISVFTTQSSLTLDYLINSCGLSPEAALLASTKVVLKNTSGPDSVLNFFKKHKFSKTQISYLISQRPTFLLSKADKTLEPKIKTFNDFGISGSDLHHIVILNPTLLTRSNKIHIIPTLKLIKEVVHTKQNLVRALKNSRWVFTSYPHKTMEQNIAIMREYGVSESQIANITMNRPQTLAQTPASLLECIKRVGELGFVPASGMSVLAINVISVMSKFAWDAKFKLLRSLGWSEEEILVGFKRRPIFLTYSEEKMKSVVDFFVNRLKWPSTFISSNPRILTYSLERRIIPRSRVWWILSSKDVIKEKQELVRMVDLTERDFLTRYVNKYQSLVPNLLKVYKGELDDFGWMDLSKVKIQETKLSLSKVKIQETY